MGRRTVTTKKNTYCHTCQKAFHYLGINNHRAMHRTNKEDCTITYTYGNTRSFNFSSADGKKV